MRGFRWLGAGLLLLAGGMSRADSYQATVISPEAEVRCGPGDGPRMYVTNRLRKGDVVEVVKELPDGWLAIKPPPGSFSWINARFVQQLSSNRPHWTVIAHPSVQVPILVGSDIRQEQPDVEGCKVARGTILTSIGPPRSGEGGKWLPVRPPPGELRYVRASAVARGTPAAMQAGTQGQPASTVPPAPVGGSPVIPAPTTTPASTFQRAQEAESQGNRAEAIRLYEQAGRELLNSDNTLANQAFNRAQRLRAGQTNPPLVSPPTPYSTTSTSGQGRLAPVATVPGQSSTPAQGVSPPAALPPNWVKSPPGRLRQAGSCLDGKALYILENSQGFPILYASMGQPDVRLSSHLGRNVELIGVREYRNDLRAWHLVVMQVRPLP